MKTEKQSRLLNIPFSPGAKKGGQSATATAEPAERSQGTALQSLAAELHQAALQGVFEYPRSWTLVARTASVLLVALAAFHLAMVAIPLLREGGAGAQSLLHWRMLGALIGAGAAMCAAAFISNLFQKIQVTPQGLGVMELTGWRRIPWKGVQALRVMEAGGQERYMVMIPFKGRTVPPTPAPMLRFMPILAGVSAGGECGIIITSHIVNFERLLQLIVSYMAQEAGQVVPTIEAYVDEHATMPLGQLLLSHDATLNRLTRSTENAADFNPYGLPVEQNDYDLPWTKVLVKQALIAAVPALMFLADITLRHAEKPVQTVQSVWVLAILALGVAELPFVAMLARTVGEMTVGGGQFTRTIWAHLELQAPRALLLVGGVALLGLGAPIGFALALWVVGICLTTYLITRFMMRLHHLRVHQALLTSVGALIYQAALLALYFGVR